MGLIISDLGRPHDQSVVLDMLDNLRPISAHLGLPCGTCSRARDRPLPKELRSKFHAPPPLRDVDNLMGFPYLTGIHKTKVDAANALYIFAVSILKKCFTSGITVSIENPQRSWIWAILMKGSQPKEVLPKNDEFCNVFGMQLCNVNMFAM